MQPDAVLIRAFRHRTELTLYLTPIGRRWCACPRLRGNGSAHSLPKATLHRVGTARVGGRHTY